MTEQAELGHGSSVTFHDLRPALAVEAGRPHRRVSVVPLIEQLAPPATAAIVSPPSSRKTIRSWDSFEK